jgi:hypothetical protein
MTRTRKLIGIAAVAFIAVGTAVAVQAERSNATVTTSVTSGSKHVCVEGTFEWRWNIAFASTCEQPDAD